MNIISANSHSWYLFQRLDLFGPRICDSLSFSVRIQNLKLGDFNVYLDKIFVGPHCDVYNFFNRSSFLWGNVRSVNSKWAVTICSTIIHSNTKLDWNLLYCWVHILVFRKCILYSLLSISITGKINIVPYIYWLSRFHTVHMNTYFLSCLLCFVCDLMY